MMRKLLCGLSILTVVGCSAIDSNPTYPESRSERDRYRFGKVTGDSGIVLFGGRSSRESAGANTGIGVNAFLWRATLDTLAFMPIVSADPFGGVVITDWYSLPETPNERFKINAFILDQQLRSDAITITVFRQVREGDTWKDRPAAPDTAIALENAVLARARELRIASMNVR